MSINSLKASHIQDIILLSNNVFGYSFLTTTYVKQYIDSPKKKGFVAISNDEKVVGYILTDLLTPKELLNIILKEKEWFEYYFQDYKQIALIKQVAVDESFRNKGIASSLIHHVQTQISYLTEIICCLAWVKGNMIPLKNILVKNDFLLIRKICDYWFTDSINKQYDCSFCGSPPCRCSTEI